MTFSFFVVVSFLLNHLKVSCSFTSNTWVFISCFYIMNQIWIIKSGTGLSFHHLKYCNIIHIGCTLSTVTSFRINLYVTFYKVLYNAIHIRLLFLIRIVWMSQKIGGIFTGGIICGIFSSCELNHFFPQILKRREEYF